MDIDSASFTGRSGVNLDAVGSFEAGGRVVGWVLDGVSPIFFNPQEGPRLFSRFRRATEHLNDAFGRCHWPDLTQGLACVRSDVRTADTSGEFIDCGVLESPLFSCAVVSVVREGEQWQVDIVIYGDCVVVLADDSRATVYTYASLERLKSALDWLFSATSRLLPDKLQLRFMKSVFAAIRWLQISWGWVRVFSIRDDREPALRAQARVPAREDTIVCVMSDGVSWYAGPTAGSLASFVADARVLSAADVLRKVRAAEDENRGFGRFDDATLLVVRS